MDVALTQITLRNSKNFFIQSGLRRLWQCALPLGKWQTEAKSCPALRPVGGHKFTTTGVGQRAGHCQPQPHISSKGFSTCCVRGYWALQGAGAEKRLKYVRHNIWGYAGAVVAHH